MDQQPTLDLKAAIEKFIMAELDPSDALSLNIRTPAHRQVVQELFQSALSHLNITLGRAEKSKLFDQVLNDLLGLGPLEALIQDNTVTEIIVIGPKKVYIKRNGKREIASFTFDDDEHLQVIINRILLRKIDIGSPLGAFDSSGSVVAVAGYTVSNTGSALIIRKKFRRPFTSEDLLKSGTLTLAEFQYLQFCVQSKMNIVISGSNETGKTTLLSVLVEFIANDEFVVVVEEQYREDLHVKQPLVILLHSRPAGVSEYPPIPMDELITHAVKMRPEWLLVGELSNGETAPLAYANYTKWMATACVARAADVTPELAPGVELIVHMRSSADETRKVDGIFKVQGVKDGAFVLEQWQSSVIAN
jgi:pilus assembly protein CpaF